MVVYAICLFAGLLVAPFTAKKLSAEERARRAKAEKQYYRLVNRHDVWGPVSYRPEDKDRAWRTVCRRIWGSK